MLSSSPRSLRPLLGSLASTAGDVFGIGPLTNSSSDVSLSVLQGWMTECVSDHNCGCLEGSSGEDVTADPELPTRILEISTSPGPLSLRLIEPRGMRGRYAALSHCWGPPDKQPLRTTKATYAQHLAGIAATELPKTFREATRVARAVGLRYLWIDSLCIIQDDRADWTNEAPRMGPLYGKAALVIAASGATDSTQGCFLPRRCPGPELRIPYPGTEESGQEAHVVLQVTLPYTKGSPIFSPLGKRGWVLQEWLLARRLVHYSAAGMTWTCQRVEDMSEAGIHSSRTWVERDMTWDNVIEHFTIRHLTVVADKTMAVQGLADSMRRNRETDAYHHGMWTADMPQQLLWVGNRTTRPKELENVPTWSWASTDGHCLTLSKRRLPWEPKPATLAMEKGGRELVLGCRSKRCALKKWKELTWQVVKEEAPLSDAYAPLSLTNILRAHFSQKMTYLMLDKETRKTVGVAMLDDEKAAGDHVQDCSVAFLMGEVRGERDTQPALTSVSLVLQEVTSSSKGTYKRLGVGLVVDEAWIRGGTEEIFRIY
ncbi:heterokaryon incompatibility protein-domain-containing protein [Staphylotrichum tortipilum]|uniref:Heterokaryon incompatibility protein-domain-containing protein n=1 Tax=Staphylotrichum tortipilum TaxID=2831512 RepID=A0AAN6RUA0_9PEZI|nr:heterokaryon incompatibility protein-domain-containing protein [Staphylotrichum longicolle]